MVQYVKDAFDELVHKVTWPTWKELQAATAVVTVASIIFALLIYVMDLLSRTSLGEIYKQLG